MRFLRNIQDKQAKLFEKGGKLEKLHPLYEANDTFLFTPGEVTEGSTHVRDALDLKRMMITVVVALIPCVLMAMYNTGLQANIAIQTQIAIDSAFGPAGWRPGLVEALGLGFSPNSILACIVHGALYYLPVLLVTFAVGGGLEALFAIVRKHAINEGFLVTGMLFPLVLPPTIPLWQVAVGIAFGVVVGKEVFGGTGMNFLNPALTARAFLFFAYPAQITGDKVWVAVDGFSGPTILSDVYLNGIDQLDSWTRAFLGVIPGSMGETSTVCCLIGAFILIVTKVGAWRTMIGIVTGSVLISLLYNAIGSETNPLFNVPFWWHFVLGGWAFGTVFMATDPVSSAYTDTGKLIYGFCVGVLAISIRVINPAYPEGMMLAILLMNIFAGLIDYFVMQKNIKRRLARDAV